MDFDVADRQLRQLRNRGGGQNLRLVVDCLDGIAIRLNFDLVRLNADARGNVLGLSRR
jgi:hypothetical protein